MKPPTLIDSTPAVANLAAELAGQDRVAVDTEFHAERRYRPALMTVQLAAADGRAWVIDALACDLAPLAPVIGTVELLLHGGLHDVDLLRRACGTAPTRLLDTQRMAGLVGDHYPARLEDLLERWLGVAAAPVRSLSDWSHRPLRPDQLAYAAADVVHLFALADALQALLEARGRLAWARAASLELLDEAAGPPRPLDAWRRWDIAPGLDADTRRAVAALMTWRDAMARDRDQPPHYLLGDALVLALARTRPSTVEAMVHDRRMASGLRKRHGRAIVDCLEAARGHDAPPPVPREAPARAALLRAWAGAVATQHGIGAELALPSALLGAVAEAGPRVVDGWRREALGPALDALWTGRAAVALQGGRPAVVEVGGPAILADGDSPAR